MPEFTVDRVRALIFRPRNDGTAPIILDRRRIYILPTRAGLLQALMLFTLLLGAINYNLALGHLLVFLLTALSLTGMLHTFRNLHGLRIVPGRSAPVFAGETAHFTLQIEASDGRNRPALALSAPDGTEVFCNQTGSGGLSVSFPVPGTRRGWLTLPRLRLASRYPLGLFEAWSWLHPEMKTLVYPAPRHTPLPPAQTRSGEFADGDEGQDDFAGFRDRQPADSPRHVAWKASSRLPAERPLLVKQFAGGSRPECVLAWTLCDPGSDEARLSQLCGWVLTADAAGARYALSLPGLDLPSGEGETHRRQCLEALALYPVRA